MTLTLIAKARSDRVLLSLTPTGNLKVSGEDSAVRRWAPTFRAHRQALLNSLQSELALFRLDLIEQEIADGYPADELRRTNNLCWELMQADGLDFNTAMRMAAEIVVACPPAIGEKAYQDVESLWRGIMRGNHPATAEDLPIAEPILTS